MTHSNLPHWQQIRALYFITFRLADSLPQKRLQNWKIERDTWLSKNPKPWTEKQIDECQSSFANRIEQWLDRNHGTCLLKHSAHREAVHACMTKFNGDRYALNEFVIASNHVHALVVPFEGYPLAKILKAWKGASARAINQTRQSNDPVWQKESYDHIVRNADSLERIREYIRKHKK